MKMRGIFSKRKRKRKTRTKKALKLPKIKTNVEGLDKLFKEGIPNGASVLIEGGPGSGKKT